MIEEQDDPGLDEEDEAAVAALTPSDVEAIDHALLSICDQRWRKVAYIVAVAMDVYPDRNFDIPDLYYGTRVRALMEAGVLEAQGNLPHALKRSAPPTAVTDVDRLREAHPGPSRRDTTASRVQPLALPGLRTAPAR